MVKTAVTTTATNIKGLERNSEIYQHTAHEPKRAVAD